VSDLIKRAQQSVSGKVLFIAALVLLLLIPMSMIKGVVSERAHLLRAARADIAGAWGNAQTIGGPILVMPYRYTRLVNGIAVTAQDELYVLPEELRFEGTVRTEIRYRGIYEVPVYTAELSISGVLPPPVFGIDYPDQEILWEDAHIALPLSDARPIKQAVRLTLGDQSADFEPGGTPVAGFGQQLSVPYAAFGLESFDEAQAFSFDLTLGGTGELKFLPLGDTTDVTLTSPWPSPGFIGAYLPETREIAESGFSATWHVLDLGRGYPSSWQRSRFVPETISRSAFGVDLIVPIGIYEASTRAAKYAVLFIGLSFLIYFLFEIFAQLRLHPLQYLLLGLANCMFYLLLLAISEHLSFGFAYFVSAAASTMLISVYSAAVLGARRRVLPVGAALIVMYAYLFVTLQAEDYALLSGTLALFVVLALFMYMTRGIDWYALEIGCDAAEKNRGQAAAPTAAAVE
jgi:inner membrane protein